jgi:hypothetical protein
LGFVKMRAPKVLIALLGGCVLGCAALVAWGYWQVYGPGGWRDQVYGSTGALASRQALDDFRQGRLRLYQLAGESNAAKYTGTNEGPFEVWVADFYPSLGRAHRYAKEQFVEFYNRKMRYMHEHPERFQESSGAQPDGAAKRSQPIRSETNQPPTAAGSAR